MTSRTNARIAGAALLLYIVTGITNMALSGRIGGTGTAGRLAAIAVHPRLFSLEILHTLIEAACAVAIGVTMYGLTRAEDNELAITAMICRVIEGSIGLLALTKALAVFWLATSGAITDATITVAGLLFKSGSWTMLLASICFAVGSLIFSCLFLRARTIPVALAWIGIIASALLVIMMPLQLAGLIEGTMLVWIPMIFFEVPLAFWLIVKGIRTAEVRA
jgi:hypothetical protein